MAAEPDVRRLLALVLDAAIDVTGAERGFLILVDGERVQVRVARNMDQEEVARPAGKFSRSLVRLAIDGGRTLLTNNAGGDPRFETFASVQDLELNSVLCAPLRHRRGTIGALYLDHRFREGVFDRGDLLFVDALAAQAAQAIETARLLGEVEALNRQLAERSQGLEKVVESQVLELSEVRRELGAARKRLEETHRLGALVARSEAMKKVFALVEKAAPGDLPVLLLGESGTGKELLARAIHEASRRKDGPFVAENCGGIPEALIESVLFGHRRGAFTGADQDRAGLFEMANGGTLFLDEVGELLLEGQKRLLRALQEGEVRPVGSEDLVKVDVRIVAATHQDLQAMVRAGTFREDLYYRLQVVPIRIPPLRERPEDVEALVERFLAETPGRRLAPEVLERLESYPWPGNVRELRNEVQRWQTFAGETIGLDDLSPKIRSAGRPPPAPTSGDPIEALLGRSLKDIEKALIQAALRATSGNRSKAAELLQLPRRTLYNRLEQYGLDPDPGAEPEE